MDKSNLTTIYWKEDYKNKLKDMIMKEEKTIEYLENIIKYFEENNIEKYKKFDKRDLDKIKKYLEEKKRISLTKALNDIYDGLLKEDFDLLDKEEQKALNGLFKRYLKKELGVN